MILGASISRDLKCIKSTVVVVASKHPDDELDGSLIYRIQSDVCEESKANVHVGLPIIDTTRGNILTKITIISIEPNNIIL